MAGNNSNTVVDWDTLITEIHCVKLMIKGMFDFVGTELEERDVVAIDRAFDKLQSNFIEYSFRESAKVQELNHG
jgi:hypothetical protein